MVLVLFHYFLLPCYHEVITEEIRTHILRSVLEDAKFFDETGYEEINLLDNSVSDIKELRKIQSVHRFILSHRPLHVDMSWSWFGLSFAEIR